MTTKYCEIFWRYLLINWYLASSRPSLRSGRELGGGSVRRSAVTAIQVIYAAPGSHLFSGRTQRICQANCQLVLSSKGMRARRKSVSVSQPCPYC